MGECEYEAPELRQFMKQLHREAYEREVPIKGVFELTPRCNFNCDMCYVHLKPDEIAAVGRETSAEEWIALAKAARAAGTLELTLTGGEVFVRQDFRRIYQEISEMGFLIQIYTNGYLLDEDTVKWLSKRPPQAVRITLYGTSDDTYEKLCHIGEGFSRVKKAVGLLKQYKIPLYLAATITRENEQELEGMSAFAQAHGLSFIHMSKLVSPQPGVSSDPKAHRIERKQPPEEIIKILREQVKRYPKEQAATIMDTCGNYKTGYWITWNGRLQLCTFLPEPSVAAEAEQFQSCWQELLRLLGQLQEPERCRDCGLSAYCDKCPGVLYAERENTGAEEAVLCGDARYQYEIYGPGRL